jgi:PiT family inorganic phosphate transporter
MLILLLLAVVFLAYTNGANDNIKGVASLLGSRALSYRTALVWATLTTFAGSVTAIVLAQELLRRFTGNGLVPTTLGSTEPFLIAVAAAAGATVLFATLAGLPISTTHALTGAMVGAGWVAVGSQVNLAVLTSSFVLPLLLSPIAAAGAGALFYFGLHALRVKCGIGKELCVCIGDEEQIAGVAGQGPGALALSRGAITTLSVANTETCRERYTGALWLIGSNRIVDVLHVLSGGLVGFARGLNDTPKMAALLVLVPLGGTAPALIVVALAIAVGGLLNSRRVAATMSYRITKIGQGQGFAANVATGTLVTMASVFGLPMSTTHVSVGALFGIGVLTRQADLSVVRNIVLSWTATLPIGAVFAAAVYMLVS